MATGWDAILACKLATGSGLYCVAGAALSTYEYAEAGDDTICTAFVHWPLRQGPGDGVAPLTYG